MKTQLLQDPEIFPSRDVLKDALDKKIKLLELEGVDMSQMFIPKKGTVL